MSARNDGIGDLMRGVLAGLAATWVMGKVTTLLYEREDTAAREREDAAREGQTAYGTAAEKAASLVGRELTQDEREQAGEAIHWALGAGAGALYGALRGRVPGADAGAGLVFGAAFFLVMDEAGNVALGLTPALERSLAFGVAAELSMRLLDRTR